MRITSSHEGPPRTNFPYSHLPYPLSRSIAWNTTIDVHSSPHHPSISNTDPLYSALGAASTTLLLLSKFRLLQWHQRMVYRAQEPFNSFSVPMAPLVMPLLEGALTQICRYHRPLQHAHWGESKHWTNRILRREEELQGWKCTREGGRFETWVSEPLEI